MDRFEDLIREAEAAPVGSWDFTWLDGRAVEERPTWRYFDLVVDRIRGVDALLEVQAGSGTMIGHLSSTPALSVATEAYPPSVALAAPRLRAAGVHLLVTSQQIQTLPFADTSFDLVISRHPVEVWWPEIARVLRPGGTYLAQHVGPDSLRSLGERLAGPCPERSARHPDVERRAAEDAGLRVHRMDMERPRTVFCDIGAIVYFLRLVPWMVPDFSVSSHREGLHALHRTIVRQGCFETSACRVLVEATRPS